MHWLQRLHLIDAPENTALHSAEVSWRGLFPVWLAALLLVAASAGIAFLYLRENARLGGVRRSLLAGLRIAIVALVLVLLIRPVLIAEFHGERPRGVVLLIDDTESMKQRDRRIGDEDRLRVAIAQGLLPATTSLADVTRLSALPPDKLANPARDELVRAVLANSDLKLRDALATKGPLQEFAFDRKLRSPGDPAREPMQTALADSLREVLVRSGGELPAGIVVMTDGRDNASKLSLAEAAEACRDKGVPLYIYGVGASSGGLLQIKDVSLPNTIFVDEKAETKDDPIEIGVRWRCRGFKQGTVLLKMTLGSQVIRREIPVKEGENLRTLVTFVPQKGKEGKRDFTATLEMKGDETTRDQWQRSVQVKNNRVKVLYVENVPRREYKFLQPLLDRDRRVLPRFFLIEGDPRLAESKPSGVSGSMFLDKFPENFPDPTQPRSRCQAVRSADSRRCVAVGAGQIRHESDPKIRQGGWRLGRDVRTAPHAGRLRRFAAGRGIAGRVHSAGVSHSGGVAHAAVSTAVDLRRRAERYVGPGRRAGG